MRPAEEDVIQLPETWRDWDDAGKAKLWEYLSPYLTDNRKARFEDVLAKRTRHLTIAIEDVFQERNAGALVRTCDCFGIQEAHIIEEHHSFKTSRSISKGAQKWLDLHVYDREGDNSMHSINALKERDYRILGATPHTNDCLVGEVDITQPTALFFGAEKDGISETVKQHADGFVKIGMHGFTESFNVSVAAAIILHDLTSRLHKSEVNWQLSPDEMRDKRIEWALKTVTKPWNLFENFIETSSK